MKRLVKTIVLSSIFLLTGCGASSTTSIKSNNTIDTDTTIAMENDKSETQSSTMAINKDVETTLSENETNNSKVISLIEVPAKYYQTANKQGTLEKFSYQTNGYDGNQKQYTKEALVYLPNGYDENDTQTKYNILYLQHGAYGNEETWMIEYGNDFKNMIDNMIEEKCITPLIIVMPYLPAGNQWYQDTTPYFYMNEIKNDLMPAVESKYHTYAENVTEQGFTASRQHRAFGGFSAGGTTTWTAFEYGLNRFKYFMPMSGGLTLGGSGNSADKDAQMLEDVVSNSGYATNDYEIFAATGTKDVAYQGLTAQIEAMKRLTNIFKYTDKDFSDGNLMYYTVKGNQHDYQYTYEYVYNGLRLLFTGDLYD